MANERERKRIEKAAFWSRIETEYVQGGETLADLGRRYERSPYTVRYHSKTKGWSKKRDNFRASLIGAKARAQENAIISPSQGRKHKDVFKGFIESELLTLSSLYARQSQLDKAMIEEDEHAAKKAGRAADPSIMNYAKILSRTQALSGISAQGRQVYPDLHEDALPLETIFEAVISERVVKHIRVDRIPGPEDDAIMMDVTEEEHRARMLDGGHVE